MSLLVHEWSCSARRRVAAGALAPLAHSLAAICEPLLSRDLYFPTEKALLSREGGRCARDGTLLDFDPFQPHEHRCPRCGEVYRGELHDRFWIYWYQLWLAERAVHAALLASLDVDPSLCAARRVDSRGLRRSVRVVSERRQRARSDATVFQHVSRVDLAPSDLSSRPICIDARHRGARRSRARLDRRAQLARSSPSSTKVRRIDKSGMTPRCSRPRECSATTRQRSTPCSVHRASCHISRTVCSATERGTRARTITCSRIAACGTASRWPERAGRSCQKNS